MKSFIKIDNNSHFSMYNFPFGVSRRKGTNNAICTRLGDTIIDLNYLQEIKLPDEFNISDKNYFKGRYLNDFMAAGKSEWQRIRKILQKLFDESNPIIRDNAEIKGKLLMPSSDVQILLPVNIGDYTDFYSSREHATNVGIMFRGKENALMPNWLHIPIAYHGRSSSIIVSGTDIHRPKGQIKPANTHKPVFSESKMLDIELEMGFFVGTGNELGYPVNVKEANDKIFGMVLVNDWSARDIQTWEYQPLGPFLAKNFATSISPWIVTMDALEPFRVKGPEPEFEPLPYLRTTGENSYDINLEVYIKTQKQSEKFLISSSNHKYLYWNIYQQLAHHTVNGCNTRIGDLMASGTISGPDKSSYGSMLELTWRGENPIKLPSGEERKFIEDNDEITITGYCKGNGYLVGFGEVTGKILPANL